MQEQRLARVQNNQSIKSGLLPAETLMPGPNSPLWSAETLTPEPNSPLWSADRLTRPSFLDLRTAAAARTRPIILPVLVDLGAFLPLRLELTCSSPAALRGVTARSASEHHLSMFVIHASAIKPQNVACVGEHCVSTLIFGRKYDQ